MGPRAGRDGWKISFPPGFDPGPSTRSQSLYRLSYPAHYIEYIIKIKFRCDIYILNTDHDNKIILHVGWKIYC